jgi:hypothetical protein
VTMSFGLPCPSEPQPMDVFNGVQQFDDVLSIVVQSVMEQIQQARQQAGAYIASVMDALQNWVQKQLAQVNKLIGQVVTVLQQQVTSQQSAVNVGIALEINRIADALQLTTQEVTYGPPPVPPGSQPFPPGTVPGFTTYPGAQPPGSQPFPPGTYPFPTPQPGQPVPGYPPSNPAVPGLPPPGSYPPSAVGYPLFSSPPQGYGGPLPPPMPIPAVLTIGGQPISATPLCQPTAISVPVVVNGYSYQPTVTVYNTGGQLPVDGSGNPGFAISYDVQSDGSVAVSVGPVVVGVRLPPSSINPTAPPCGQG